MFNVIVDGVVIARAETEQEGLFLVSKSIVGQPLDTTRKRQF
jgi:hypothetical protein